MTKLRQLHQMQHLVQAAYDQQQQNFGKIIAEETTLRRELQRVDQMDLEARIAVQSDIGMRAIGSDVIWQSWVGRTKTQLNLELARVLAIKEQHLAAVRKAYGKVMVVEALITQENAVEKKAQQKRALDTTINYAVSMRS